MIQQMKQAYKKIITTDISKLLYSSIFILFAGFMLNGCILKICENFSEKLYSFVDILLFVIEGTTIAITLFVLLIRRPKRIISIYAILGITFLFSFFIFPQNKEAILSIIKNFFLYCVTCLILFWEVSKDKELYRKIINIVKITFGLSLFYFVLLILNGENLYNQWLSGYLFFTGIFNLYDAYKNKRISSIIINFIISFITLLSTGSRTYLMLYILFAILLSFIILIKKIKKLDNKKRVIVIISTIIIIALLTIILMNYQKICDELFYFFADRGIEIRILRLLATENFFTSNERISIIYPTVVEMIEKNWLLGLGIGGERSTVQALLMQTGQVKENIGLGGCYAHNFILELYVNFGIIIATGLLVFMGYSFYRAIKNKYNDDLIKCFFVVTILPLMLTGTFWSNVYFWALIGILLANFGKKNKENIEKKEMNKIIMLLDNAFEPDIRVYKEAKYLVDNSINVEIVCLDTKNKYIDKATENYDGISVRRIFCRTEHTTKLIESNAIVKKLKKIIYLWWLLKFIFRAKQYLRNKEFEILHCHDLIMGLIGSLFFANKQIVFDMHEYYGNSKNKLVDFIIKKMTAFVQNRAKWIIYVNEVQKKNCNKKNLEKFIQIPNYPDKKVYKNSSKTYSDKIRISYIGKVRDYYSLSKLIDCAIKFDDLDISIYGNGSEYESLMQYAKNQGRIDIMKGYFSALEDAPRLYSNTDILYAVYDINCSHAENWKNSMPIKSFEAIITTTPIIASKNTVLGNFVEKNNIGFTVDIRKSGELEELLERIINNKNLIDEKIKNLKKIQYIYTWNNVIKNIDKIYLVKNEKE